MIKFNNYLETLEESLNSPVEFYMTDDTVMPKEIYGCCTINGTTYGMSLILTKYDKIYNFNFYRIINVKKRTWSFTTPKDILPAISTCIKFMEACYPFVQQYMDGILLDLSASAKPSNYVNFLTKVVAKSYVKKYRVLKFKKVTENLTPNWLFMIKQGVDPKVIYKTATFNKNFEFDPNPDEPIPDAVIKSIATEPYKVISPVVSTAPSKKYVFDKLEVSPSIGDDLDSELEKAVTKHKADPVIFKGDGPDVIAVSKDNPNLISINVAFAVVMPNLYKSLKSKGFDKSKLDFDQFKKRFNENIKAIAKSRPDIIHKLEQTGMIELEDETLPVLSGWCGIEEAEYILSNFPKITQEQFDAANKAPPSVKQVPNLLSKKLPLDIPLKSQLPAFDKEATTDSNLKNFEKENKWFLPENEDVTEKQKLINSMGSVSKWRVIQADTKKPGPAALIDYTGSHFATINSDLRSASLNDQLILLSARTKNLLKYVDDAPALEDAIYVYRNTNVDNPSQYDIGDDYIDPGFLSTSIRSNMGLGSGGNIRLKIYIPKGSKVFPILDLSNHSQEYEVVLPAFSVLKITAIHKTGMHNKIGIECVYTGNAAQSFLKYSKSKGE